MTTKRGILYISAVVASLLAASALSTHRAALAATCLTEPNHQNGQGGHWYYRVDRVNHRNCWYVRKLEIDRHQTAALRATVSSEPIEQPTSSWSSWLTGAWSRLTSTEAQRESTKSESTKIQNDPTAVLTIDDILPKHQSERKSHLDRALKSAPKPAVQHSDEHTDPPMSRADRDALFEKFFQEFLRWKDRQTTIP
jgi:hypothetical protein